MQRRIVLTYMDDTEQTLVVDRVQIIDGVAHFRREGIELLAAPLCNIRSWG